MTGKDLKRIKELEEETLRLKQMYASLALDHQMDQGDHRKKALKPCMKREISKELAHYGINRACRVLAYHITFCGLAKKRIFSTNVQ